MKWNFSLILSNLFTEYISEFLVITTESHIMVTATWNSLNTYVFDSSLETQSLVYCNLAWTTSQVRICHKTFHIVRISPYRRREKKEIATCCFTIW